MILPRRQFLRRIAAQAGLLIAAPALTFSAPALAAKRRLLSKGVNYADMKKLIGTSFFFASTISARNGTLKLSSVRNLATDAKVEQFQLRFVGEPGARLPSGLYDVSNWDGLPHFQLYVQRGSTLTKGCQNMYAVCALLKPQAAPATGSVS